MLVATVRYGVAEWGPPGCLRIFAEPSWIMIPLNLVEQLTRTFSLAVRLFGNVMSGVFVVGLARSPAGLPIPIPLMALDLLTVAVQATSLRCSPPCSSAPRREKASPRRPGRRSPPRMADMDPIGMISILAVSFGAIGPSLAEGRAVAAAMDTIARQPEAAGTLSRTLFGAWR